MQEAWGMRPRSLRRAAAWQTTEGAVMLEFLLAFPPVLLVFLAVVQLGLIGAASLLVSHAASRAARSAAVVIDDSPSRYDGEPAGQVEAHPSWDASLEGAVFAALDLAQLFTGGRSRLRTIRFAASMPLAPLAPPLEDVHGWFGEDAVSSVKEALGDAPLAEALSGLAVYNLAVLAVTPRLDTVRDTVSVDVEYLFHCGIPVVASLLCSPLPARAEDLPPVPARAIAQRLSKTSQRFFRLRATAVWPRQRFHRRGPG